MTAATTLARLLLSASVTVAALAAAALIVPSGAGAFEPLGEQFRISSMGPNGDTSYDAHTPSVAYNPSADEYLVVWQSDDILPLVEGEYEIFAQRLSGSGAPLGGRIRVSAMGPDGGALYDARNPSVAYDPVAGEYLVVWEGDDDTPPLVNNELEIFAQRLSAAGVAVGGEVRVSEQGTDGMVTNPAGDPSIAYNPAANEYLVAWRGEDGVSSEGEIWAQRLSATGGELGGDFRVSDMGPEGEAKYEALWPSVAANPRANEYLVTWSGDDTTDNEYEIFAQRLTATGVPAGANDFRVSDMGPDGSALFVAYVPSVAYNPSTDQYLVTWSGDDDTAPLVVGEFEVMGQRLSATGMEEGANDFRISDMGPDGDKTYIAQSSAVAVSSATGEYLVVWWSEDDTPPLVNNEHELFGQRLSAAGAEAGANDFRVSDMGPGGDPSYGARWPSVAFNSTAGEYVAVWEGDDDTPPLVKGEFEIFGRRLGEPPSPPGGGTPSGGAPGATEPPPGGSGATPVGGAPPAFGARTLVTLALAPRRIRAGRPLGVRIANANGFAVTARLAARSASRVAAPRRRTVKLKAKAFALGARAKKTVRLLLPQALRRLLRTKGRATLRLSAKVTDPAGNTRTVRRTVTPRARRR